MRNNDHWISRHRREPENPDRDYMTPEELKTLAAARERGDITIFRVKPCGGCRQPISNEFVFCSKTCKENKEKKDG